MAIILYSIPLFFLLIGAEVAYAAWSGRRLLRLNDSVADLSCGILSQLSGIFTKLFAVGMYIAVERRWAVQRWLGVVPGWPSGDPVQATTALPGIVVRPAEVASWVAVFVLVDLAYYWSHRLSHEVNVLWAGHVVHHSSEEYNLTVALRQSSLHGLMTWVFYIPLALLGVPWRMYVACYALNLVYQFWIHTRSVGRLAPALEAVLNTPSHHRVHHGTNAEYLDRNYGGVLIVWDRLFGTFEPEAAAPVYGITKPLRSWNPLWANVHVYWEIARETWRARSWRERWLRVFGPPGWSPAGGPEGAAPEPAGRPTEAYDPTIPRTLAAYAFGQFLLALGATLLLLRSAEGMPLAHAAAGGFYIAVSLAAVGGIFQAARWAGPLEAARLLALAAACAVLWRLGALPPALAAASVAFCAACLAWFLPRRRHLTEVELAPLM